LTLELEKLPQGDYIVFLQVDWVDSQIVSSFVLSSFSDNHINLEAADKSEYMY